MNISRESSASETNHTTIFGFNTMKVVFAMEYVLQGLANPFQGITYHSFFRHFHFNYGLTEAHTQKLFSRSYLAWGLKPFIGFFMDAYGKTRTTLIFLLLSGSAIYLLTPWIDFSAMFFFWTMFALAFLFAATDVAVDRATVIEGDEEARTTGKSKATTVGLNQAICWAAIYGTSIVAGFSGGWIADNVPINSLMYALAIVPFVVFLVVLRLPRDKAVSIPLMKSMGGFWKGLNTGPIMWIMLFYFLFHFQPALGALWTNYLMEQLHFTQTQIGISDGFAYTGFFLGVILFAWLGVKWQDRWGLKSVFKVFILLSVAVNLTQYLLVDPYFTQVTDAIHRMLPGTELETVRLTYISVYSFFSSIMISIIRMSTFSLVGAVIPVSSAGSLFAGFMSVANLAYSFSYSSGSWLYEHGLNYGVFRGVQNLLFGIPGRPGDTMSISLLIFIGSMAYLLSFLSIRMLPDRQQTQSTGTDTTEGMIGPDQFQMLGPAVLRKINTWSLILGGVMVYVIGFVWKLDVISTLIMVFCSVTFIRKVVLDYRVKKVMARKMMMGGQHL